MVLNFNNVYVTSIDVLLIELDSKYIYACALRCFPLFGWIVSTAEDCSFSLWIS